MAQVHPKHCHDHRLPYLGECPFCLAKLEPLRFAEARRDFAGLPLAGTRDILPHYRVVSITDVVAVLGTQLAELERQEAEAIRPYAEAKQAIYRHMRRAKIDPAIMQRAVRIHLGIVGAERLTSEAVAAVLEILRQGVKYDG